MTVLSDIAKVDPSMSPCYRYELLNFTPKYFNSNFASTISYFPIKRLNRIAALKQHYVLVGYEIAVSGGDPYDYLMPIALSDNKEELLVMADVNGYEPIVNKTLDI